MRLIHYTTPNTRSFAPVFGNEIDQLFETALSGVISGRARTQFPVELNEDKDNIYVRAELPGVSRDDINVELADGVLALTATRKEKTGEREESRSFSRSVVLPDKVQADKVAATYLNGVLTVTLPKSEEVKPRKITVA